MNAKPTPTEKLSGALTKQEQTPPDQSLVSLINKSAKELGRALPSHLNPERLTRIALTTIRLNPELANCTPESFLGSLFVLAQLGLEPIAGRAYLLPFRNNRKVGTEWKSFKEVQALIGYKGYIELYYRHESALSLDVQVVYSNDEFDYQHGTEAFLRHKPAKTNRGEPIGFYAIAKLKGGGTLFHYMSKEECLEHGRSHSKTYDDKTKSFYKNSPWATEFEAMAKKTVLLQLSKLLPLSMELQRALQVDETSRDFRAGIDSALDMPVTTTWKEVDAEEAKIGPVQTTGALQNKKEDPHPEPGSFEADATI